MNFDPRLLYILFAIHLALPLSVAGVTLVPEVLLLPYVLVGGIAWRVLYQKRTQRTLLGLGLLCVGSVVFNFWGYVDLVEHLKSSVQLFFSVFLASCLVWLLKERFMPPGREFSSLLTLTLVLMGLCVMELALPPFERLMDAFRHLVFPAARIYEGAGRDRQLFGFARPVLFGNEPSYLGITMATLSVALYLTARSFRQQAVSIGVFLATVILVRSPTAIPIAAVIPYAFAVDFARSRKKKAAEVIVVMLTPLLVIAAWIFILAQFGERLDLFMAGRDNSSDMRLIKPMEAVYVSMSHSPLTGTGIGGRTKIMDAMLEFSDWGHLVWHIRQVASIENMFSTGLFLIFVEMGLLAVPCLLLLHRHFRHFLPTLTRLDFAVSFVVVGITMGGWVHPRIWLLLAFIFFFIDHHRRVRLGHDSDRSRSRY